MTPSMSTLCGASSSTVACVFTVLAHGLLVEIAVGRTGGAGRGRRRRSHRHSRKGGLISSVSSRLRRRISLHPHLLLNLWKLKIGIVRRESSNIGLPLDGGVCRHALQGLLYHAHVNILLVRGSDLLLLLLKKFDLLLKSKLFHHERRQFRRAASMGNMKSAPRRARHAG